MRESHHNCYPNKSIYRLRRLLVLFVIMSALLSCASPLFAVSGPPKTVRIGAFNFYPAIFQAPDGTVQGFYVDFLKEIAERENWKIEYVYGSWADGLDRIKSGEVDVLTNVAFTEDRALFMDYGKEPLLTVWAELYAGSGSKIDSILDVANKKIAIMKGDFNGANFKNLVEKFETPCQVIEYKSFEDVFKAIVAKQVDGGVVNNTFGTAKQHEYDVKPTGVVFNPFNIYFTVAKGKNLDLLATLDKYLVEWRKTENSPYHLARERWSHKSVATMRVVPAWLKQTLVVLVLVASALAMFIVLLRSQVRRRTAELKAHIHDRQKIEETLFFVNASGSTLRGDALLAGITAHLSNILEVDYAFVGELTPERDRIRTKGLYANGSKAQDIEYFLHGTPCENVVGKTLCIYPANIVELFPEDKLLVEMGADGYAATPLWDSLGEPIGLMGIITKSPLANKQLVESVLQIVANRAAQELEAVKRLSELELKNFTIENIRDAVYWISSDGMIKNVNQAAIAMLRYSREEFLSMSVADIDPLFPRAKWPQQWAQTKEMGNSTFESIHRTKDGHDVPVEITVTHFTFDALEYHCAVVRDITERKLAVTSLLESSERLEQLAEHSRSISWEVDSRGLYTYVSTVCESVIGYRPEELIGTKHFYDLHPDEVREALKKDAFDVFTHKGGFKDFVNPIQARNGKIVWVATTGFPVLNPDGTLKGYRGSDTDITERRLLDETQLFLLKSATLYPGDDFFESLARYLAQCLNMDYVCIDRLQGDGCYAKTLAIYFDGEFEDNVEYALKDTPCGDVVEREVCVFPSGVRQLFSRDRVLQEMMAESYVGTTLWSHDGRPIGLIAVIGRKPMENSQLAESVLKLVAVRAAGELERRQAEEERLKVEQQLQHAQKLESLGVLSGGIAHDFNNILAIIIGYCSLAAFDPENAANHVSEIEKAANRAAGLCRQMLTYAGKAQLTMAMVDMRLLVDDMISMLTATLPRNVHITADRTAGMPPIYADASQLRQVVMNLIINASEAIGKEQGEVRVSLTETTIMAGHPENDYHGKPVPPGKYLRLVVTDTGCGMSEETKQRIFEPFYTTKFTGRGLGMSAVLGIIMSHGGALQLFSRIGEGTTFKVYLPVQARDLADDGTIPSTISSVPWQGSGTILLVDDEDEIRRIAATLLGRFGFTVLEAANGRDALAVYREHGAEITVVMTDVGMPIMDGYELCRELKKLDHRLPIIISSGFGDADVNAQVGGEAIAGVINKPYNPAMLQEVLQRVVERD